MSVVSKMTKLRFALTVVAIAFCTVHFESSVVAQSWSNGYSLRSAITIVHSMAPNTDQINFLVLISGTYAFEGDLARLSESRRAT